MSLFKKTNRKFKQRSRADSDEESEQIESKIIDQKPDIIINLDSNEKKDVQSKNVKLSFDEEQDVTEFKLKKSNSSLKALKQLERQRKELKRIKKQNELANQTKSVRKLMETNKETSKEERTIDDQPRIINLDEDMDDDDDDQVHMFDKKTIEKLKRQRFLAKEQQSGSSLDYISLNITSSRNDLARNIDYNYESSINNSSRLVREDPCDKEEICIDDDEENVDLDDDRVNFYSDKSDLLQKERIKEAFFNAQIEEQDDQERFKHDSDNEIEEWERAQINKGIGFKQQRDLRADDFGGYLLTNQHNQVNSFDPPAYIKLIRPALTKDKLLKKYNEELQMIDSTLIKLVNQMNNIEMTIDNIKETLGQDD